MPKSCREGAQKGIRHQLSLDILTLNDIIKLAFFPMRPRSHFLLIVSAILVIGVTALMWVRDDLEFSFFEQKSYTVDSLLKQPVFDEPIRISGKIEGLGTMECPCFEVADNGQNLQVWYDLMLDRQNASQPKVDVSMLKNGLSVTLKGVLKKDQGPANAPGFWLLSIERASGSLAPTAIQAQGSCQQQCVAMGFADGKCQTQSTSQSSLIRVGDCSVSEAMACPAGKPECGCMCAPTADEPQLAAPPAAVFLLEQVRARSGVDFSSAHAIEMRYPPEQDSLQPPRWLVAAATTASGESDLLDRINSTFEALGAEREMGASGDTAVAGLTLWRKGQIICLAIRQELDDQKTGVELQCAVMPAAPF